MSADADLQELELDIDLRLAELLALVMSAERGPLGDVLDDDASRSVLFSFLRASYAYEYGHALQEAVEGRAGALYAPHGYAFPTPT